MTAVAELFLRGTRLGVNDRYEIRERIGKGAMAEVFRAADRTLHDRPVAIKTLSGAAETHRHAARLRELFIAEARALTRVDDDNVVKVYDAGATSAGTPYMVMEFLQGEDLDQLLKREGRLPVDRAIDVVLGAAAGLQACHVSGVVHRDVKPANIFLAQTLKGETPKVLDFSVAKIPIDEELESTATDLVVGTPSYMAPEQAMARRATKLSDQYSLAAVLFRCLVGRPPKPAITSLRDLLPEVPDGLERALLRALDGVPENRFSSVHEFGKAIQKYASPGVRAKWSRYYSTPPLPLPPVYSGAIESPPGVAAVRLPLTAITEVANYEVRAHDLPTSVRSEVAKNSTAPSTVGESKVEGAFDAGAASSSIPITTTGVQPARELRLTFGRRLLQRTSPGRLMVGAAVAIGALILGVIVSAQAWRSRNSPSAPPPPWTNSQQPSTTKEPSSPSESVSEVPGRPPESTARMREGFVPAPAPGPEAPAGLPSVRANESGESGTRPSTAVEPRARKKTRKKVRYTPDGIPILY